mgnify:CR=1 FL=1
MAISKNINLEKLFSTKGQFLSAKWQSNVPTSAKHKDVTILKVTEAVVRAGINFSNLTSVKTAIENNERGEVQPLKWGQWIKFPYLIGHKDKKYVRLYPSKNNMPKVKYFLNGIEVKKAILQQYLTPSKWNDINTKKDVECFSVSEENIHYIK